METVVVLAVLDTVLQAFFQPVLFARVFRDIGGFIRADNRTEFLSKSVKMSLWTFRQLLFCMFSLSD